MTTKISNSFKMRLLVLFLIISAVPLMLAVAMSTVNMISDANANMESEGTLRNRLAQEKISELYEKNLNVLRVLAENPMIHHYLTDDSENRDVQVHKFLDDSNEIFHDGNNIIITGTDAWQLYRTDELKPVNVQERWYFWESMGGREAISEVVVSLATGRFISVVEVPVLDATGKAIGLVQRDYDLGEIQRFVETLATEHTRVVILDRTGRILAHSSHAVETEADRVDETGYEFVQRALSGESGSTLTNINGEDTMVSFSRNALTGWVVLTIESGTYLQGKIYSGAIIAIAFGITLLFIICFVAYLLADTIARPIIDLNNVIHSVAGSGQTEVNTSDGDELSQMAKAIDKIQNTTDTLRRDSETDKLTGLYNKAATEKFCRTALKNLKPNTLAGLYLIDLDHFKEANDTYGHQFGDRVLQEFAKKLHLVFNSHECIGRFGGDEFIVFVDDISEDVILRKAAQITASAREIIIDDMPSGITASVGIATANSSDIDYKNLFAAADKALYNVKEDGRDGYCLNAQSVCHE